MKSHLDRIGFDVSVEQAHRSCLDKVRYDSRNKARDRSRHLRKKYPEALETRPYRCTLCDGWHLASVKGKPNGKTWPNREAA